MYTRSSPSSDLLVRRLHTRPGLLLGLIYRANKLPHAVRLLSSSSLFAGRTFKQIDSNCVFDIFRFIKELRRRPVLANRLLTYTRFINLKSKAREKIDEFGRRAALATKTVYKHVSLLNFVYTDTISVMISLCRLHLHQKHIKNNHSVAT